MPIHSIKDAKPIFVLLSGCYLQQANQLIGERLASVSIHEISVT